MAETVSVRGLEPEDRPQALALLRSGPVGRWGGGDRAESVELVENSDGFGGDVVVATVNPDRNQPEPRAESPGGQPPGADPTGARLIGGEPPGGRPTGGEPLGGRPPGDRPGGAELVGGGPIVGLAVMVQEGDGVGRVVDLVAPDDETSDEVAVALLVGLIDRLRARNFHALKVPSATPERDGSEIQTRSGLVAGVPESEDDVLWIDAVWTSDRVKTARLVLRAPLASDNAFVVELLTDPGTRAYLGGPASFAITEWVKAHSLAPQWGSFIVWMNDQPQRVGMVELDTWRGELELSCHLLPEFWGLGYGRESIAAALEWAWANTDEPAAIAVVQPANAAALALLEGAGFARESVFEEDGESQVLLRINRPEPEPSD